MKTVPKPSGKSTASRATYASVTLIVFIAITLTILATACSSTSIEEPQSPNSADGDDLMITLSTPTTYTFPSSRADETGIHAGHELRYTAILYKSNKNGSSYQTTISEGNFVERKEILAKDGNKIVFKGKTGESYFIVAIADYIEANSQPINGHYPDKYYDTQSSKTHIKLISQTDKKLYFNNDNLDLFLSLTDGFTKEAGAKECPLTIKRRVSKIQVIATGGSIEALENIEVNKCSMLEEINVSSRTATSVNHEFNGPVTINVADRSSKLLFFYYTFNVNPTAGIALKETTFTLNPNEGYEFNNGGIFTIPNGKIIPRANTKYNVQSDFLNTSKKPSKVVEIKVTTDENWTEESQTLSD